MSLVSWPDVLHIISREYSPTPKFWADCTKDGEEFKKCKNMAFFHSLTEENFEAIKMLICSELGE